MPRYSIFKPNGDYRNYVDCTPEMAQMNCPDDHTIVEGDWEGHYINEDGVLIKIPEPTPYTQWDEQSRSLSTPDLAQAREDVWVKIKTERDHRQLNGGVFHQNHWFLSNERAQSEYTSIVAVAGAAQLPPTFVVRKDWRTMDGGLVDMTPALAATLLQIGINQRSEIDDAAKAHFTTLNNSEEPWNYSFSQGWPMSFQDWEADQQQNQGEDIDATSSTQDSTD